jgi:FRG domain
MVKKRTTTSVPPRSLTEFIEEFARYFSGSNHPKCYRGQRDATWLNIAGIFRPQLKELLENEKKAVRELISVQPHEFSSDDTMFEKLVRMQHFGLPTRLLDVSRNALVALFFATDPGPLGSKPSDGRVTAFAIPPELEKYYDSDSVSCIANLANMTSEEKAEISQLRESLSADLSDGKNIKKFNEDGVIERLLQFIRAEKPYFQPIMNPIDLFTPYYVHPKMSNRRILAQSGAFIIYGLVPPKTMFFPYEIERTEFVVPQAEKSRIREALANIGIDESTLFPEIDKAAARIKNSYARRINISAKTKP